MGHEILAEIYYGIEAIIYSTEVVIYSTEVVIYSTEVVIYSTEVVIYSTEVVIYSMEVVIYSTEVVIQLPLMRFPDSRISSLTCSWLRSEKASGHQKLASIPINRQLPDGDWSTSGPINFCKMSPTANCLPWGMSSLV